MRYKGLILDPPELPGYRFWVLKRGVADFGGLEGLSGLNCRTHMLECPCESTPYPRVQGGVRELQPKQACIFKEAHVQAALAGNH